MSMSKSIQGEMIPVGVLILGLLIALTIANLTRRSEKFVIDVNGLSQTALSTVCKTAKDQYLQTCTVDCVMSEWTDWSNCSKPCDGGTHTRTRKVLQAPLRGGKPCGPTIETKTCNSTPCAVNCKLSPWTPWTECTKPCNTGSQMRARDILTNASNGGEPCQATLEVQSCNTQRCSPVPCELSEWSEWSPCTAICGGGTQKRDRTVTKPPLNGGSCDASLLHERRACNTQSCPE